MTEEKSENGIVKNSKEGLGQHKDRLKQKRSKRCRRRVSQLLHTHVALITVCVLSALDASCVLGQIICDILIMTEKIHHSEVLESDAAKAIINTCQSLNGTDSGKSLQSIVDLLNSIDDCNAHLPGHLSSNGGDPHDNQNTHHRTILDASFSRQRQVARDYSIFSRRRLLSVEQFAGGGDDGHAEHTLLEELTHVFHLGSMVILSVLVLETFVKIFSMGEKFLHHRLEVFDAFVVTVSWCLDIAFYDGIWAKPGTEAATILIFILPWRVIRIVNSFVLVIQEKDLVQLKIVKQQYRRTVKRANELKNKTDKYRAETRTLQGLCRKYGANEDEIQSCAPMGKRRKSSNVLSAMNSFASLAMIGAVSSVPDLTRESSDEEDESLGMTNSEIEKAANHILRSVSTDSMASSYPSSPVAFSLSPDPTDNQAFVFDEVIPTRNMKGGLYTKM